MSICLGRCQIDYLSGVLGSHSTFKDPTREGSVAKRFRLSKAAGMYSGYETKSAFLLKIKGAEFGLAEPRCVCKDSIEHRL